MLPLKTLMMPFGQKYRQNIGEETLLVSTKNSMATWTRIIRVLTEGC
jgi:hypothetical protein